MIPGCEESAPRPASLSPQSCPGTADETLVLLVLALLPLLHVVLLSIARRETSLMQMSSPLPLSW